MEERVNENVILQECVIEMLQEMYGEESVPKMFKGDKLHVTVDNKRADIDLLNMVQYTIDKNLFIAKNTKKINKLKKNCLEPVSTQNNGTALTFIFTLVTSFLFAFLYLLQVSEMVKINKDENQSLKIKITMKRKCVNSLCHF